MLAAKAVNLGALTLVAGLIAVAGCLITGRLMLPAAGIGPAHGYPLVSLTHAATLRAATGSVLYLILIALLALGVATAIRDTAVSTAPSSRCSTCPRSSPKPSLTPSDDISSKSPP
jgi:ABC-2 type transport system permease protein